MVVEINRRNGSQSTKLGQPAAQSHHSSDNDEKMPEDSSSNSSPSESEEEFRNSAAAPKKRLKAHAASSRKPHLASFPPLPRSESVLKNGKKCKDYRDHHVHAYSSRVGATVRIPSGDYSSACKLDMLTSFMFTAT
jgi:hypothetical protein